MVDSEGYSEKEKILVSSAEFILNWKHWGWSAFQTVNTTQKRSKNGGQMTAIIYDSKIGNYPKLVKKKNKEHLKDVKN